MSSIAIPTDLVTNLLLSSFCSRNIPVFSLKLIALYFRAMANSIDFYKEFFLHVIPVGIIVPC